MRRWRSTGRQQLTVSNSAVTLTVPSETAGALIYVGSNPIRFTLDGTDPTSSLGIALSAGDFIDLTDPDADYRGLLLAMKLIRSGSSDAVCDIEYLR